MEPPTHPAFRRLDIHRIDTGDQRGVILIDPLGIAAEQVMVPEGLLPVFGLFDGVRSSEEIQRTLQETHGEAPDDKVTVENGVLDVELGDITSLEELAFDTQYYLGVQVESDDEMLPLFKLTCAPYAIKAL